MRYELYYWPSIQGRGEYAPWCGNREEIVRTGALSRVHIGLGF